MLVWISNNFIFDGPYLPVFFSFSVTFMVMYVVLYLKLKNYICSRGVRASESNNRLIIFLINPFASIGRTGTLNIFLLKSAGRRTGTSNDISMSKVSLYISRNMVSFFFLLWF